MEELTQQEIDEHHQKGLDAIEDEDAELKAEIEQKASSGEIAKEEPEMVSVRLNKPCPCGSGRKAKKCCFTSEIVKADVTNATRLKVDVGYISAIKHMRRNRESILAAAEEQHHRTLEVLKTMKEGEQDHGETD